MDTQPICPSCRKPLPANAPQGICPECLMKAGFGTGTAPEEGGAPRPFSFQPPLVTDLAKLFPQLEISELLGQGGMGAVYKARQPALDRLVALKILPPALASGAGFAERFTREARALARLTHSNIVAVHDFGKAGDFHYLIMEFVDGANLRQVEQAGKLQPAEALQIIPQICAALQFAHDEGIVHRDIKPENILIDKRGRVKIADFGIAKMLGKAGEANLTGAKDVVGTPHYMAPEQVERPQTVDHRADIYSLGVVFYEMLTGELPIGKFAPPSKKVQVDVRLDEVVLHTLEKEPDRRYQRAGELKTDVETIASGRPSVQRPVSTPAVAGSTDAPVAPSSRYAQLALGLFLAGTLGTLVLMSISRRDEPALVFGGLALLLALVFAVLSSRGPLGKGVSPARVLIFVGAGMLLLIVTGFFWTVIRQERAEALMQRALAHRAKAAKAFEDTKAKLEAESLGDAAQLSQEGWRLWKQGQMAEAIAKFAQATRLEPTNSNAWNGLGWASFNSGKPTEAEKAFLRAIDLDPTHAAALNGLGQIYLAQKNYAQAEAYLLKASNQKASAAWHGLARLYLLQGRFEEAEKWAQNIVDAGQADELVRRMLQAAKEKKLSEGLRLTIEP